MKKAIFFDIDGTLVSFKTHQISESTIKAVHLAKEKGHRLFIATGRAKPIMDNISVFDESIFEGYVTMNGGYCYTPDQVLHKSYIPKKDVEKLAEFCEKNNYPVIFVREHDISVCQPNHLVKSIFYEQLNVATIAERSFEDAIEGDIYQMSPFITKEQEKQIIELLPNSEPERWHPSFVDIVGTNNTKETGIEVIREHFDLALEDTVSIGDGGNDISMLAHTNIGIAMGNAADNVKAAADYVTTSVDEDGVWNALKHYNLI